MVVFIFDEATEAAAGICADLVLGVLAAGLLSAIDFFVTAMGVSSNLVVNFDAAPCHRASETPNSLSTKKAGNPPNTP
jgi:hypothetical protein